MNEAQKLYAALGATPVINALGNRTMLGGSNPAPEVLEAMRTANRYYVDMDELFEGTGKVIAQWLECEAALVTPGCAAALLLGTAACMTGTDPDKMEQLPDVTGLKSEIVIQKAQRYKYDRVVRLPGTRLVEVGTESGATAEQLAAAIGPDTAAVLYPLIDAPGDLVPLQEAIAIAHQGGAPIIVDAAYRVYPLEGLKQYTAWGADLVGYGAKYFGAPNSSGILCGRRDLVEAARLHSFASFEKRDSRGVGRPLKIDRQEVIGVLVALRHWLDMDHGQRHAEAARRSRNLLAALQGTAHLELPADGDDGQMANFTVRPDESALGKSAIDIADALQSGNPSIWTMSGNGAIHFSMFTVVDGDEEVIAERLKEIVGS